MSVFSHPGDHCDNIADVNSHRLDTEDPVFTRRPISQRMVLCLDSASDIPLGNLDLIDGICLPKIANDGHIGVICRIKGIHLLHHGTHDFKVGSHVKLNTTNTYNLLHKIPQVSVFDTLDILQCQKLQIYQYFVRWEHLIYQLKIQPSWSPADAIRSTESLIHDMATAAGDRSILLRLPDVRSDDVSLATIFFDHKESNPALGNHGTRYWLGQPKLLDVVRDIIFRLPPNVSVAAPFVTSRHEFKELTVRLENIPLVPFVESPQFVYEYADYRDVSQVSIGLKDLSYLLLALDRESAHSTPTIQILQNAVNILKPSVQNLTARGIKVTLYCPREEISIFEEILDGCDWVPSIPAADAKMVAPHAEMKGGKN
jgi:hypothetical protein